MKQQLWHYRSRVAVPQILTASRVVFGAAAIVAVEDGRFSLAATLITLGAVTDGLDGFLSRRLAVASPFGGLFDYFSDYMCFVVAPWVLTRALLGLDLSLVEEAIVALPLVTGAIRYARNGVLVAAPTPEVRPLPGLGTIFFTFLSVTAVFLDAQALIRSSWVGVAFLLLVAVFSVMMVAPIPYPKLTRFRGAAPAVLILLVLMPFFGTRILAGTALCLGLLYAALAPFAVLRQPRVNADAANATGESVSRKPEFFP